jgi:hypothetical protein
MLPTIFLIPLIVILIFYIIYRYKHESNPKTQSALIITTVVSSGLITAYLVYELAKSQEMEGFAFLLCLIPFAIVFILSTIKLVRINRKN